MTNALLTTEIAALGFAAAGSEARLTVLRVLVRAGEQGLIVADIQQKTRIPASTLAHHLKFLTAAGLIVQEKQGRAVINKANYQHIEALAAFLTHECCADACNNKNDIHQPVTA